MIFVKKRLLWATLFHISQAEIYRQSAPLLVSTPQAQLDLNLLEGRVVVVLPAHAKYKICAVKSYIIWAEV